MEYRLGHLKSRIQLGQVIGRGHEGTVYELVNDTSSAVKIYNRPVDDLKREKLSLMGQCASSDLRSIAAWPKDFVVDENGRVAGFVMPKIPSAKDIHELYTPKSRLNHFPNVDFRFIVHVAANIARAFAVVHANGHVIGDVNHGSILLGGDGTVRLIDCDSFQIKCKDRILPCVVGTPLFTAPEIQGRPFNNLTRTVEHDNFALAVILFQLLFMGRHPFAGRYEGPGEMPIEQAITEKRFPYGTKAARSQMKPPPGALSLSTMGDVAAQLFLDAFENTGPRPRAAQWVSGMQALKGRLVTCSVVTSHYYHSGQQQCPWCVYERTYNTTLFNTREYTSHKFYPFDVKTLWAEYHAVAHPVQTTSYPNEPPSLYINEPMSKYVAKIKLARKIHFAISAIVLIYAFNQSWISMNIIIIFIVFILIWFALNRLISTHRDNLSLQRVKKLNYYQKLFNSMSNDEEKKYALILKDCESMIKQIWNIPDRRNKALESLSKNEKQAQLEAYLSRFRIERANIPNIGSSLNATLASFGIETAADIQYAKVRAVPGFGDVRVRTLMEWRMAHELKFRYIPNDTSRDQEANKIDTYYHQKQEQLVKNVRSELMRAKALFNIIADNQNKMRRQLELALKEYQEADLKYRCDL